MKKLFILLSLCLSPTLSFAGGSQSGTITQLALRQSDGLVLFTLSGTAVNKPACGASTPYWVIKDETSVIGKQQAALLLSAHLTSATVNVIGNGTCERYSATEDVDLLYVEP
jgi:hypothetical protein